jgi:hypothetical protein
MSNTKVLTSKGVLMSLNYQQVRQQVQRLGENAPARLQKLQESRDKAHELLKHTAREIDALRQKVERIVRSYDNSLRCALPVREPLNAHFPHPALTAPVTILAADGSQINPDRHAQVEFSLINVGAICTRTGSVQPPVITIKSELLAADDLSLMTENRLALKRDLAERAMLAELATGLESPIISFTDGPMELWGSKEADAEYISEFQDSLAEYILVLQDLSRRNVVTAGYVDKPFASPLVRLLEVASATDEDLPNIRHFHPLRGVRDTDLLASIIAPGERSAVFALQSQSSKNYANELALHFFYLNVGRPGKPWLVRVETPAWVVASPVSLDALHAVLVDQCRILGTRPYPYLLHRAHETAVVSLEERDQVTQMIVMELQRQGVPLAGQSQKQALKQSAGRTRFQP